MQPAVGSGSQEYQVCRLQNTKVRLESWLEKHYTTLMVDNTLHDLEQRYQQLQRLVELSVILSSTLDLDDLLQLITATATELLDCEAASILLYDDQRPRLYF